MSHMLHDLFAFWMQRIHDWGYAGVFWLMALESTVFPIPSEIVVPPAAYWVSEGRLSFWGVVLASTFGSWLLGAGFLVMLAYLLQSLKNGPKASSNPWGAASLEW